MRLESLILSSVQDINRKKPRFKSKKQKTPDGFIIPKMNKKTETLLNNINKSENHRGCSQGTIRHVAEARISLLIMARCRSVKIRDQSMILLCEALDSNVLDYSEHEIMHLQMLWVELVQLLRQVLDSRRMKQTQGVSSDFVSELGTIDSIDSYMDNSLDSRTLVDIHFEHILVVM
jgi:hypothetical protein